jgi:hypothetical protein
VCVCVCVCGCSLSEWQLAGRLGPKVKHKKESIRSLENEYWNIETRQPKFKYSKG